MCAFLLGPSTQKEVYVLVFYRTSQEQVIHAILRDSQESDILYQGLGVALLRVYIVKEPSQNQISRANNLGIYRIVGFPRRP